MGIMVFISPHFPYVRLSGTPALETTNPWQKKQTIHVACIKYAEHEVTAVGARPNTLGATFGSGINGLMHTNCSRGFNKAGTSL